MSFSPTRRGRDEAQRTDPLGEGLELGLLLGHLRIPGLALPGDHGLVRLGHRHCQTAGKEIVAAVADGDLDDVATAAEGFSTSSLRITSIARTP